MLTYGIPPEFRGGVHYETAIRHRVSPEFIGSRNCVPMAFTAESPVLVVGFELTITVGQGSRLMARGGNKCKENKSLVKDTFCGQEMVTAEDEGCLGVCQEEERKALRQDPRQAR